MGNCTETWRTGPLIAGAEGDHLDRSDRGFSDLTEAEVQAIVRQERVTPLEAVVLDGQ